MDNQTSDKCTPDNKRRKVSSKLSSAASMPIMGLLGLCVLVETEGLGAQANLLEEGIPSGSPILYF